MDEETIWPSETGSSDFVIVGSGVAGLFTAIRLSEQGTVTVLSKQDLVSGNTWFAQGGIAAATSAEDSPELHFEDTYKAGAWFGDREAIKVLVEEAPARIEDLLSLGVNFDRTGDILALGREGAHSQKRILHIGGDATGRELLETLIERARDKGVHFIEGAFAVKLLLDEGCCDGLYYQKEERLCLIRSRAVIMATGGCGRIFQYTTNAPAVTGDGLAMAYDGGAVLRDLEFFQFHPTVFLPQEGQPFLISEAVRGEGAHLVNKNGRRFMTDYHEQAELGPRDIVSRAIVEEQSRTEGPVYLDLRPLGAKFIPERFPTIYNRLLSWGIDSTEEFIPVTPAAHYLIGGIAVDLNGHTAVKNLYAVGEAASTGVHGANRLASNSLLEGLVFGHRVAEEICANSISYGKPIRDEKQPLFSPTLDSAAKFKLQRIRETLPLLMWEKVGLIRNEEGLQSMLEQLKAWQPLLKHTFLPPGLAETRSMLLIALMMAEAALLRRESRGCHSRADYPETDPLLSSRHLTFQSTWGSPEEKLYPQARYRP